MASLPETIKRAAVAAFYDNAALSEMTLQEREQAAHYYEEVAADTRGTVPDLARLYNLERAKFLRGEVASIVYSAPQFAEKIGYRRKES